ncbi:MAG TPA: hypothetical protein VG269_22405 [Tepidisphaeraceae bacterium]|jgi:hypothetical protein|nr:hypothetical protein [Tepidisphaeraceae bacterium]
MNAKLCLAGLFALGGAMTVGCAHHQADARMETPAPVVSPSAGGAGADSKVVETNKVGDPAQNATVVPTADHVSTGADLKKPEAPATDAPKPDAPAVPDAPKVADAPKVPDAPKPDAPAAPDAPKPDAPKVPDAPKPDAPAVPDPTVKPDPAAPEPSVKPDAPDAPKPDATKATDATKAAIEKEVGTQDAKDAPKAPDAGK